MIPPARSLPVTGKTTTGIVIVAAWCMVAGFIMLALKKVRS